MGWPCLSLTFDGIEGSLGAGGVGKLGTGVSWVLVAFGLGHAPFPLRSQHPPLKCEGFGLAGLGGLFLL